MEEIQIQAHWDTGCVEEHVFPIRNQQVYVFNIQFKGSRGDSSQWLIMKGA